MIKHRGQIVIYPFLKNKLFQEVQKSIPHISILLLGIVYLIFLFFWFTFYFLSCFKCTGKDGGTFSASSCGLVDIVGSEKGVEYKKSECKSNEGGGDGENK